MNTSKICTLLKAFRLNLAPGDVHEFMVDRYHILLSIVESKVGENLVDFKIRTEDVSGRVVGINDIADETVLSEDKFCERKVFLSSIDGLIAHITVNHLPDEVVVEEKAREATKEKC